VKSLADKVWENGASLEWFAASRLLFAHVYQLFLVLMKKEFKRMGGCVTVVGALHEILMVLGEGIGW
jgi:hypothetical protein